jgi:hypothetical protein
MYTSLVMTLERIKKLRLFTLKSREMRVYRMNVYFFFWGGGGRRIKEKENVLYYHSMEISYLNETECFTGFIVFFLVGVG